VLRELFVALEQRSIYRRRVSGQTDLIERLLSDLHAGANPSAETESMGLSAAKTETEFSVATNQLARAIIFPK